MLASCLQFVCSPPFLSHSFLAVSVASQKSLVEPLLRVVLVSESPVPTKAGSAWVCQSSKGIAAGVEDFVSVHVPLLAPSAEIRRRVSAGL